MKSTVFKRVLALLLALTCVMGVLPLSAFAATGLSSAPGYITQKSSDYMRSGGRYVRYQSASATINAVGRPYVFDEQVTVPGLDAPVRALCAYQIGTLDSAANGQKWNYKNEVTQPSLKALLTYVYSCTYGNFTDAGNARGLETWGPLWSNAWFVVGQAMTWYYEHGIIIDVNSNREGFIQQASEEMVAAFKMFHDTWNSTAWITDWDSVDIHTIIDSKDNGVTGYSAYDYISTGVNLVLDHPEYFPEYHLWEYEWDSSQPWKITGQEGTPMQRLLIAVPDGTPTSSDVSLTVKKLEAGTNKPLAGVSFKVESTDGSFSVTRTTGANGTITLTSDADDLTAGQYKITEEAVPEGYVAQTASQTVTVLPNSSAGSTFTFYNEPNKKDGDGSIRKVDADNPTVGIPGAVIRITSVKLDDGGSFFGEYITGDGGYIPKSELDFSKLPTGSFLAEEITPPQGFILSSDVSKVKRPFVWDGEHDVHLVFENSSKVKIQLVKVDEGNNPVAGAVFLVLRDGQIISTEETKADGTITVSNVTKGHYEFIEVFVPDGLDCDRSPVGVHVDAEDLQGEQTITVTKVNYHKRSLTIQKRDAETGDPIPNTSFHVRGANIGYENDVVTGADGKVTLTDMPSGCYEITETAVPAPWILDTNNRQTVWIDSEQGQDVIADFVNSTRPELRLLKLDEQTGKPVSGATFLIEEVGGGFSDRRQTDQDGLIVLSSEDGLRPGVFQITEVVAAPNYVLDDTVHTVVLEENRSTTIELTNLVKPTLKILKVDSITKQPLQNAKFQIWRASGETKAGDYYDLGIYYSNEAGEIVLEHTDPGWFKITELEAPSGYSIKQADYEFYLAVGESKSVQVENEPLSALVVYKYDRVTGEPVEGAVFQIKYLSGTSGTGGTVIGTYRTQKNGSFTVTGLQAGAYTVEELASDSGHIVDAAPQTAYISGKQQEVVQLYFGNSPKSSVLISKVDANDGSPLSDVEFLVTISDGTLLGNANGKYVTDSTGTILIENLDPNLTLVIKETRAKVGYILDDVPQTIKTKPGEIVKLEFRNKKQGNLIIHKLSSADNSPIEGAQFKLTYADGRVVDEASGQLSSNGLYWTSKEGQIVISGITGTVIATEVSSAPGFAIDPNTRTQTIVINPGDDTQHLWFYNDPVGGVEIIKVVEGNEEKRIPNVTFEIRRTDDALVDTVTTGSDGRVFVSLEAGSYYAVETKCPSEFKLDSTPHYFEVVTGKATPPLVVTNKAVSGIVIHKTDSVTGKGIYNVSFLVYDSGHNVIGQVTTDNLGFAYVEGLDKGGRYYLRELDNEGYIPDTQLKTVEVKAGESTLVEWKNTPITAQIQITKKSADYNSTNGLPAGTLLEGAVFEIRDKAGNLVDTIRSDSRGVATSKPLPLSRYTIREVKAPANYGVSDQELTAYLEHAGQIVRFEVTNKSLTTGVSITKTGPKEAMAGQPVNYSFSSIGNNSNVMLTSFYWRDTLPAEVRLNTVVTGTYNFPGVYKITYRVNGGEYRTLADNLSTGKNYTLAASDAALGLASNERVTEIMFVFGQAPAGFAQVEKPQLKCTAVSAMTSTAFTNIADVGGVYNGQWVQAISRWVTTVYGKPVVPTLPKTGY